jgi:predicted ATPase
MPLALSFLGTFDVRRDGAAITDFRAQNARALLAYLALESDRPHEREHLCALLWPDQPLDHALTNLRQALHRLRQAIEPEGREGSALLINRQAVQLDTAAIESLDVAALGAAVEAAQAHRHRRLSACPLCVERLRAAAALYRGEFLAGFNCMGSRPFEAWLLLWRERLHHQFVVALEALADHYTARGEDAQARDYLRRWLAVEPWREAAHQQLMRVLARGDQGAALRQFESCRAALARLGAEPTPETVALAGQIKAEAVALRRITQASTLPIPVTPFVGRADDLERIAARLNDPDCRLLTLVGPGGSGKTRLALAAAAAASCAFGDGAVFVALEGVTAIDQLPEAIATALGLTLSPARPVAAQICRCLCARELLLVLDNFDHLLDGPRPSGRPGSGPVVELVRRIVREAPAVTVLAASRAPLDLRAEWLLPVAGMALPPATECESAPPATAYDAGKLFLQTARRVQPGFAPSNGDHATIGELCRRLDGMPLAIELAATQLRERSLAEVAAAVAQSREVRATTLHDLPQRQRSVRAVFDRQAAALIQDYGDPAGDCGALNDRGKHYTHLGLYAEARDCFMQTLRLSRQTGDRASESAALAGLSRVYHHSGDQEQAAACARQAIQIDEQHRLQGQRGYALTALGYALEQLGRPDAAARAYDEAVGWWSAESRRLAQSAAQGMEGQTQPDAVTEPAAGLARLALAQGRTSDALAWMQAILPYLERGPLRDALEPLRVHLTCYQVLLAAGDQGAEQALGRARTLLHEQAERIRDPETRRAFLENVAAHRAITGP